MHNDVTMVCNAHGLLEILFCHEHGQLVFLFELFEFGNGLRNQEGRKADRGLVNQK